VKVLGIESSSTTASIAVIEDDKLLVEYTMNNTMKHSKTLLPMLEDALKRLELDISAIDLVAVSEGPGSFTGLRIGSATAKGIAQGLNLKVASIPTLEVLAGQICVPDARVGVVLFARAREVYYGTYEIKFSGQEYTPVECSKIKTIDIDDLVSELRKNKTVDFLIGDGVGRFDTLFLELLDKYYIPQPVDCSFSAKTVAKLGLQRYYNNDVMTYFGQKPYYHKKSQAEREYEEKQNDTTYATK